MPSQSWLIVSNRLPVTLSSDHSQLVSSSGGLVTAIMGIRSKKDVRWLGCVPSGIDSEKWKRLMPSWKGAHELIPLFVKDKIYDLYYNGFCNDLLWPLFHYESNRTLYKEEDWQAYVKVNQLFANAIVETAKKDEIVWIHDFHLFLLPKMIKDARPDLKVGFFLHIPFPSSEIYRQLPHREKILKSLLAADLIGFHDYSYLRHFTSSLIRVLGLQPSFFSVRLDGHITRLGVFPVSIDTEKLLKAAETKEVKDAKNELKSDRFTFLGVDRLDYTKGLPLKLEAYRNLLRKNPELAGKVRLIQVAVPTRQGVPQYMELKSQVERMVGEINGEFGTPKWVPILYIYNTVSFRMLLALYQVSDALMVTSIRDGMNLVTLEFIASQSNRDPGVVLLSEFTGAHSMLNQAVTINPWDTEETSNAMLAAVNMSLDERRERWTPMVKFLRNYSSTDWAESFVEAMSVPTGNTRTRAAILDVNKDTRDIILGSDRAAHAERIVYVFDYDGTLVPIEDSPDKAVLPSSTLKLLNELNQGRSEVVVVSGRAREFLRTQFEKSSVRLVAEHGAYAFDPVAKQWRRRISARRSPWYASAKRIMEDYAQRVQGSFVEEKSSSIAWHYRRSNAEYAEYQAHKLYEELEMGLLNRGVNVLHGKKVIEARPVEANKGYFVRNYLESLPENVFAAVFGDDRTDEDMFASVKDRGVSVRIGVTRDTLADYCLRDQNQLIALLKLLANKN